MYIAKLTYDRIVYLSEKNKIQISKINELCSISKDTLSASARSKEGMKAKKLYDISEIFDCSVDYLVGRTDNPKAHKSSMSEIQIEGTNKRNTSLNLSENEFASIKRYSALDSYGKSLVDTIIDKEYNRCTKSKTFDTSQFSDDDIIETPTGRYKVAHAAAFGGGTMDILIPADVSSDEINRMIDEKADSELRKENEKIGDEIIEKAKKSK